MVSKEGMSASTAQSAVASATSNTASSSRSSGFDGEASSIARCTRTTMRDDTLLLFRASAPHNRRLAAFSIPYQRWRGASATRHQTLNPKPLLKVSSHYKHLPTFSE